MGLEVALALARPSPAGTRATARRSWPLGLGEVDRGHPRLDRRADRLEALEQVQPVDSLGALTRFLEFGQGGEQAFRGPLSTRRPNSNIRPV